jgi:hypothetical protein
MTEKRGRPTLGNRPTLIRLSEETRRRPRRFVGIAVGLRSFAKPLNAH